MKPEKHGAADMKQERLAHATTTSCCNRLRGYAKCKMRHSQTKAKSSCLAGLEVIQLSDDRDIPPPPAVGREPPKKESRTPGRERFANPPFSGSENASSVSAIPAQGESLGDFRYGGKDDISGPTHKSPLPGEGPPTLATGTFSRPAIRPLDMDRPGPHPKPDFLTPTPHPAGPQSRLDPCHTQLGQLRRTVRPVAVGRNLLVDVQDLAVRTDEEGPAPRQALCIAGDAVSLSRPAVRITEDWVV